MDSPSLKPRSGSSIPGDGDVVPETAMRAAHEHESYHVGRGGEGNTHRDRSAAAEGGHVDAHAREHEGLKEKAKHLFGGAGKKE